MKSLNLYFLLLLLVLGWSCPFQDVSAYSGSTSRFSPAMSCPNTCQVTDSLALVAIYNATNGPGWTSGWNLNTPVCSWSGVTLNASGNVEILNLNANNLTGALPSDIGDLSYLESLRLDNNNISGTIPGTIGNLTAVKIIFLDNNSLTGTIPASFGNLSNLITLFLDNNQLSGTVPVTFDGLTGLQELYLNNNRFDSIPVLSGMITLQVQNERFRIDNNRLTFDDIIVHGPSTVFDHYTPQDSVFTEMSLTLSTGSSYTIDLGFDSGVTTNLYQWYKDGIPFGLPLTTNKLTLDPVTFAHTGEYRCQVTNSAFTQLTLHTRPVTINVICGISTLAVNDTICYGDARVYNGNTYDASLPSGTELLLGADQYGCDSSIVVNLNFRAENIVNLEDTLCAGDTLFVDGVAYHQNNTSGTAVLENADQFGCDTTVVVDLSFRAENIVNLNSTLCAGDTLFVDGVAYHQNNTSGTAVLENADQFGCDSTVVVDLSFRAENIVNLNSTLCAGDTLFVDGVAYHQNNTSGTAVLENADQFGCDSTVVVDLSFRAENIVNLNSTLCAGDTLFVDGVAYHQNNTSGTAVLENADQFGCDSTVVVDLSFRAENIVNLNSTLCAGDTLFVDGVAYHQNNTSGTAVLENADQFGCDSTVVVDLSFRAENIVNLNSTLCAGDTLFVDGVAYHQNNTSGTAVLENADQFGCDSTVVVDLSFRAENIVNLNSTLCAGDTLFVNGVAYHQNNTSGTAVFENADQFGCDSTVIIDLSFRAENIVNLNSTLCAGDTLFVNGVAYHQNNTSGTAVFENADQFGCDSTVIIDLSFRAENIVNLNSTLCAGDTLFVNGVAYHQNNTSGTAVFENADQFGCDSTVIIDLSFRAENIVNLNSTLCAGDTLFVNGVAYHQNNTSGTAVLENADQFGCDSTVIIDLSFRAENIVNLNSTLCAGDTLFVDGVAYHQNNTSGTAVLENADQFGCDSTVIVDLSFRAENIVNFNSTLCAGDTLFVDGVAYHQNNTSGTAVLENADQFGCDSTVIVDLSFRAENIVNLNSTLCAGDTLFVDGVAYHQNNTSGTAVFENADQFSCDSTVIVDLSFRAENIVNFNSTLCAGDTLFVDGVAYHQNNTSGTAVFENADQFGCDSTVVVDLSFRAENIVNLNSTLCAGDTLFVDGVAYHQNNTSGTAVLENADQFGCDSTVMVDLSFRAENIVNLNSTLCAGDTLFVDGVAYHQNNTSGTAVFENADQFGCDSTVIVDLSFRAENIVNLNSTLCAGDTLFVDGVAYHQNNTSGTAIFENADQFGCDSTVVVDLSFYPEATPMIFQETICSGDSLLIHGIYLHNSNPTATIILENQGYNSCDSIIEASVDFYTVANGSETINLCTGDSIIINGITFNQNNQSGAILYENASQYGCDSTVNISIFFQSAATGNYAATLCPGESVTINGNIYNEANPSGAETLTGASYLGCDSTIQVSLSFNTTIVENIAPTLCPGEAILVNGTTYNESNPSGTEMLPGGSFSGCDSTIVVDLSFYPSYVGSVNEVLCPGESIMVNGTVYDDSNSTGVEIIPNGSITGCDSTVNISISFYAQVSSSMTTVLCDGESLIVNGVTYDAGNPNGTEILPGASFNGCDSTVVIDLEFHPPALESINDILCPEDTVWVGGIVYHSGNPSGTEILSGASFTGCDSTVTINLDFYEPSTGELNLSLCSEQGIFINGTAYNESNPFGIEEFPNGSFNGCDSVLVINLAFNNNAETTLNPTLCPGEIIVVNGVTYDEDNPSGMQFFENEADNGCDSTVYIDLTYYSVSTFSLANALCPGDSLIVNGTTYNFFNPSGTEILPGAGYTGCDSIIEISISFYDAPSSTISATLCAEEEMVINGIVYNISNPNGTELFPSSGMNGCDSVVLIDLTFWEEAIDTVAPQLCPGESITINGNTYDENTPGGTEVINNATTSGCDSTIVIDLQFYTPAEGELSPQICAGDTIFVNGNAYHENNTTGSEILINSSVQGCDSIIHVNLSILPLPEGDLEATICSGDTLFVNGSAYHQGNLSGTELLENASFDGCDSIVQVNVSISTPTEGNFASTICPGDTLFYHGQAFHQDNNSGAVILENASQLGCDSVVQVNVNFYAATEGSFASTICLGDTLFYNGQAFHQDNSSGAVILENASQLGCDSVVQVNVNFYAATEGSFASTVCLGDTLFYHGQAFHQDNSSGAVILENASHLGCDSVVQVSINFYTPAEGNFASTICPGDTLFYNGQAFHQDNSSGAVILENASHLGCDSVVQVSVNFYAATEGSFASTICPGDTLFYNGQAFHQDNASGTVVLEQAAENGCDSIVQVEMSFYEVSQSTIETTLCIDEALTINGTVYNQDNPSGTEFFQNGNGCDSIVTINLSFLDAVTFDTLATICEGDLFLLADRTFSETGSYDITLENAAAAGCDSIIQLTLEVLTPELLGTAELGDDLLQCEQTIALSANQPSGTTGLWSSLNEMNISNPHDNLLTISEPDSGWNTFLWTLSSDLCKDYDTDTIRVFIADSPLANDDLYTLSIDQQTMELDLLGNDDFSTIDAYFFELLSTPERGEFTEMEEGYFLYERADIRGDQLDFSYQLCNEDCPELCDTANVRIMITEQDIDLLDIPNAITPNDDGVNEFFVFPHLEFSPDQYPDKELLIFNRWGNIVYEAKPYENDWYGQDRSGKPLPQGTYYYVLRLDINNAVILKGDVSILK